ncbi:MAG: Gp19/Gp15/Gp42 family protein [Motilibacteraceae bacterium]
MAGNPAAVSDLVRRWRPLSDSEQIIAASLLDDAWQILLSRVALLQSRLDPADTATTVKLDPKLVVAVETAMVLRVLRNPDGKRQESIDDYSWTRDNAVSAGLLYATDDELAMLAPAGASTNAFTITPTGTPGYATGVPVNWFELNL